MLCSMCCVLCITISIISNPSDEGSLRTILESISTLTAEWFKLGVVLGLSYDTLKIIEHNYRDPHRCLTETMIAWLRMKDNSQPSWQSLTSALGSSFVDRKEIAVMIAADHHSVDNFNFSCAHMVRHCIVYFTFLFSLARY